MEECIFCRIVKKEIPCFQVYEDERVLAFMDINPIAKGHTLLIPKKHAENIWEIDPSDLAAVHLASHKVASAMRAALKPAGIAMLQLNGKGVNQAVMHYHLHLMPRISGNPELRVTTWDLKPGDMNQVKAVAQQIIAEIR